MPSKGKQPLFNQRWLKLANLKLFDMPSKGSLLPKHVEWPHVLRDLGILSEYCKINLNTLNYKKYQIVTIRC